MTRHVMCATVGCKDLRRWYDRYCPAHRNEISKKWREAHPEKMKESRDRYRAGLGTGVRGPKHRAPAQGHPRIVANGACVVCDGVEGCA